MLAKLALAVKLDDHVFVLSIARQGIPVNGRMLDVLLSCG